jgi:hypothetical protein
VGLVALTGAMFGGFILLIVLMARFYPGSGADLLDWDPSERMDARYAAEFEDLDNLLEQHNRRQREQGLPEHTEDEYREIVRVSNRKK